MFEKEGQFEENTNFMNENRADERIPAALTDIGCEREINEDRYAVIDSPSGQAWVVCDGMGGVVGGELAAQLAIDTVRRALENGDYASSDEAIRVAIEEANRIIVLRRQNPAFSNMGTTIVSAMINDEEVTIANAGDSRVYVLCNKGLKQLTIDHTYVQELLEKGEIKQSEVHDHPQAHVLTRCVGASPKLKLDFKKFWIWPEAGQKDQLIICSDGLYSLIADEEIAKVCGDNSPQEACVKLVELAKARGGYDNITLVIVPLEGQLREEELIVDKSQKRKTKKTVVNKKNKRKQQEEEDGMSTAKKALLFFLIFGLGIVITALIVLLQFVK